MFSRSFGRSISGKFLGYLIHFDIKYKNYREKNQNFSKSLKYLVNKKFQFSHTGKQWSSFIAVVCNLNLHTEISTTLSTSVHIYMEIRRKFMKPPLLFSQQLWAYLFISASRKFNWLELFRFYWFPRKFKGNFNETAQEAI